MDLNHKFKQMESMPGGNGHAHAINWLMWREGRSLSDLYIDEASGIIAPLYQVDTARGISIDLRISMVPLEEGCVLSIFHVNNQPYQQFWYKTLEKVSYQNGTFRIRFSEANFDWRVETGQTIYVRRREKWEVLVFHGGQTQIIPPERLWVG
jgi:hypothetical protein